MKKKQEYTWREAQDDLEQVAILWATDHSERPGSPIEVWPSDIENNSFQDVDEVVTWATAPPRHMPEKAASTILTRELAKSLGGNVLVGWLLAAQIAEDLKKQLAFVDQPKGPTITEQIQDDMRNGLNIAQALPHQVLEDLGVAALATVKAVDDLSYIKRHNFVPLSPTMKFEAIAGKPIPKRVRRVANQVWVWPHTPSAGSRDIPRSLRARMGRKTSALIDPILDDSDRGTIFYTAYMGSSMISTTDPRTGKHTALNFPEVYDSAAGALGRTDRVLPFAVYKDPLTGRMRWDIGHFINREEVEVDSENERNIVYMDVVMQDLRLRMQRLARVPVKYTRPKKAAELLGPVPTIANLV